MIRLARRPRALLPPVVLRRITFSEQEPAETSVLSFMTPSKIHSHHQTPGMKTIHAPIPNSPYTSPFNPTQIELTSRLDVTILSKDQEKTYLLVPIPCGNPIQWVILWGFV